MNEAIYIGKTTRVPFLHCPACGQRVDGMTSISPTDKHSAPTAGSITVCLYCSSMLMVEQSLTRACAFSLRMVSKTERAELAQKFPEFASMLDKMQRAAREMIEARRECRWGVG
jgi:hypothetical protein